MKKQYFVIKLISLIIVTAPILVALVSAESYSPSHDKYPVRRNTFRLIISGIPIKEINRLKKEVIISKIDRINGTAHIQTRSAGPLLKSFLQNRLLPDLGMENFSSKSRIKLNYYRNIYLCLPDYLPKQERHPESNIFECESRSLKSRLTAVLVYRVSRRSENIRSIYNYFKGSAFRIINPFIYRSAGVGNTVNSLLDMYDHIVKIPGYKKILKEIKQKEEKIRTANKGWHGNLYGPVLGKDQWGEYHDYPYRVYTDIDLLWLASFWMRRFSEGNMPTVHEILLDIATRYSSCSPEGSGEETEKYPEKLLTKDIGGITFIKIPGGSFIMGSPVSSGSDEERPCHRVDVDSFWMSRHELANEHYYRIMGKKPADLRSGKNPVNTNWKSAVEFTEKFGRRYGVKTRLPYEAEWEYAARAGTGTRYYWGSRMDGSYAWYAGNSGGEIHPVGQKKPNRWGLHDMSGNVIEWCMDKYDKTYYMNSPAFNPAGPLSGKGRVVRGGEIARTGAGHRDSVRSASRTMYEEKYAAGIRLVIPVYE